MDQITASQADRAAVAEVLRSLGPVAVVRMVPVTVATADQTRRRTHVLMFDATGADLTDQLDAEGAEIARDTVRSAFPGRVWTAGAYDYHAFSGRLLPVVDVRVPPGVPVVSLSAALDAAGHDPATLNLGRPVADAQDGGAL